MTLSLRCIRSPARTPSRTRPNSVINILDRAKMRVGYREEWRGQVGIQGCPDFEILQLEVRANKRRYALLGPSCKALRRVASLRYVNTTSFGSPVPVPLSEANSGIPEAIIYPRGHLGPPKSRIIRLFQYKRSEYPCRLSVRCICLPLNPCTLAYKRY